MSVSTERSDSTTEYIYTWITEKFHDKTEGSTDPVEISFSYKILTQILWLSLKLSCLNTLTTDR